MKEITRLKKRLHELLDKSEYKETRELLNTEFLKIENCTEDNPYLLAEIAGGLISLGSESFDKEPVNLGLDLFSKHRDWLEKTITKASIDYCVGNGQHALYKIAIHGAPYQYPKPKDIESYLFEAKASYFRAFKALEFSSLDRFSIQVLTNLGNNLSHSGRYVEAIQLFDTVLSKFPDFPQALGSKANLLKILLATSKQVPTLSLISEIYALSSEALRAEFTLPEIKQDLELMRKKSLEFFEEHDFDSELISVERQQSLLEYQSHQEHTKFFLDSFLSLSEHSLFCKCNAARLDDLMIGYSGYETADPKLLGSEQILNRIKSEFYFAKTQLFDYISMGSDNGVFFQEIDTSIINGLQIERLRSSFRMCFGILDKIARGICLIYDLSIGKNENIYFESFWRKKSGNNERWNQINEKRNIHLTALYSIATDLTKDSGELGFYKQWRNKLEHDILNIVKTNGMDEEHETDFPLRISETDFKAKALHLLQITRAAVFSFAFCARTELVNEKYAQ